MALAAIGSGKYKMNVLIIIISEIGLTHLDDAMYNLIIVFHLPHQHSSEIKIINLHLLQNALLLLITDTENL